MARCGACVARCRTFLSHSVTPPQRGGCLSVPTRSPLPGVARSHADRLRARRLPAGLADAVGPLFAGPASGRSGDRRGIRRIRASDRLSAGGQSLWPQPFGFGAASSLFAGLQGRLVLLEASPILSGSDSRRGPVRLRRVVAGRFSQRHLLAGNPAQCAPVSATVRRSPNRLSGLRCGRQRQRPTGFPPTRATPAKRRHQGVHGSVASRSRPQQLLRRGCHRCGFHRLPRSGTVLMNLSLVHQPSATASASPYRLLDEQGQEVAWANAFLDAQRVRQLSPRSLRAYAYDLLHFARWLEDAPRPLAEITESTLLDYVRHQLDQEPKPSPQTVNHRLGVVHCLYRFHCGQEIPAGQSHFQRTYTKRSPLGYGRPRRAVALGLRLRQPQRVVVPLSADEVAMFWRSFRTFRDLALVGLMLLDGLRSCEVLALQLEDLQLAGAQMRVLGKGNKKRGLPLPPEIIEVLEKYLRLERPPTNSSFLFVSLKGRQRGRAMSPAGLRSLFRHHRGSSKVARANAHRFRHTFGADMVRAGISLPALQHLMGHSQIRTTMLYVQLAPQDVWREYACAIAKRTRLGSSQIV